MDPEIEEICNDMRRELEFLKGRAFGLKKHGVFQQEQHHEGQHGEMLANIMLTYRHLEDARMRLGKVMQHAADGVSKYDKPDTYQDRVRTEAKELERRRNALVSFMMSPSYDKEVPEMEQRRHVRQQELMSDLLVVLQDRIDNFTQ